MTFEVVGGILLPFVGTALGAATVFFFRRDPSVRLTRALSGFAAGVMVAASVWSLLLPAIDASASLGTWSFLPAVVGVWGGVLFLALLDRLIPHLHIKAGQTVAEGPKSPLKKTAMLALAVTLHNLPEGMAVGVVFAGYLTGQGEITLAGAMILSLGIAIQNFPEGAIISLPVRSVGVRRGQAFRMGVLSGVVEPIGAVLTVWLSTYLTPILPYCLAFAAGAMLFVVVEELIPEMATGDFSNGGTLFFTAGFTLMMLLDVALS